MNRGSRLAVGLVLTAAAVGGGLSATASAAPRAAADAVLIMHAGGDRATSANTVTGGTVAGTAGVVFTVTNGSGTQVGSCTTIADGTCTVDVANGQTYTVTQTAVPAGWFLSPQLSVGTSATITRQIYSRVSVTAPTGGGNVDVPATGTSSANNTNNTFRSGVWAASRDNPVAAARCGLNVALLFDLSGSVAPSTARYHTTQADVSAGPIVNIGLVQGTTPTGAVLVDASPAFVFPTEFFFPVTG